MAGAVLRFAFQLKDDISSTYNAAHYTDKKEIFHHTVYKEIPNGAVSKSYMTNGLLIYGEIFARFPHILGSPSSYIYDFATATALNFLIYEENLIFFFISV
jgi:hypothetical protein